MTLIYQVLYRSHNLFFGFIGLLLLLILGLSLMSLSIQRLHDAGYSGWWTALNYLSLTLGVANGFSDSGIEYIEVIGTIIFIILVCLPSKQENNEYK